MAAYIDVDQSGDWSTGDIGLKNDGSTYANPTALDYQTIDSYSGNSWDAIETMAASAADDLIILWDIPIGGSADNTYQGDSVSFDITFTLEQAEAD